ncbi:hypothetical protein BN7_2270 [Wickerhamomyces ciferrii]|uniref:Uncharacterized protein n=1 Tax=Wickerhamomyces ciferrii (strain ATCC 14091 / BCRC 22168 / CBS 111 / JCM 3599 / NBRC 0793 / NRRL Y-1031 F-60-10) TaxID=1206466 RepID=K0KI99_WICCF|nr:uncharacterized protein BN7_2270 [Wickerhamomyces ciferrii]CCH42726.1 hypothetical protein BN7_2270 [Wickerhamomyces ciferrii]
MKKKTFDLSLDDTELDDSGIESDHQHHNHQEEPASQILDKEYILPDRSIESLVFGDIKPPPVNKNHTKPIEIQQGGNTSIKSAVNGGGNTNLNFKKFDRTIPSRSKYGNVDDGLSLMANENLIKSIKTLQKISGTEVNISNYNNDNKRSLDSLTKLNMELVENSELKLKFIEKNYRFLENLYEDLTKNYELDKSRFQLKQQEFEQILKQWEYLGDLLKKEYKQDGNDGPVSNTPQELIQLIKNSSTPVQNSIDKDEIIKKQEKEIKDYKRFIKEMMER